jgi:electron transfer flavoprotein beta subunit
MTNIVVLIKQVPDTWSERKLKDGDWTLDREAADAVLDEINERAVEEALLIREKEAADGTEGSVTVLTAGPERATEAIRKGCTAPTSSRPAGRWPVRWAPSRAPSW